MTIHKPTMNVLKYNHSGCIQPLPGGLVVRIPHFHCRGRGFDPWSVEFHMPCGEAGAGGMIHSVRFSGVLEDSLSNVGIIAKIFRVKNFSLLLVSACVWCIIDTKEITD